MYRLYFFSALLVGTLVIQSCGKPTQETQPIRKDVTETVFASGVLEASDMYKLTAPVDGYLTSVNFNENDLLPVGKLLAVVENKESGVNAQSATELLNIAKGNVNPSAPLLAQAKKNIEIAKQKMEQDAVQEERYKKLWQANSIARVDYENVLLQYKNSKASYESSVEAYNNQRQLAEQQLINNNASQKVNQIIQSKNQIRSLVAGKVYKKYKQTGDYVKRGDVIAEIGNADKIYAKISIDESVMSKIKIGQKADVELNTQKGKVYKATLAEIMPSFDENTQSFACKLFFDAPLDFTINNTQLQSNIIIGTTKNAMVIPRNYIDYNGFVMVKGEKSKRKIKTGFISNNWVQVLEGIDDKSTLVTDNIVDNSSERQSSNSSTITQ